MIRKFNPDTKTPVEEVMESEIGVLYNKMQTNTCNPLDLTKLSFKLAFNGSTGYIKLNGYEFDFRMWLRKIVYKINGSKYWYEAYCINKTLFRKYGKNIKDIYYIYNPFNPNEKRRDYN